MGFKDQVNADLDVFHNTTEFADVTRLQYDGEVYNIPAILDYSGAKDRNIPSGDNADGIFLIDLVVYIAKADLPLVPRKGHNIEIGENRDLFNIVKVEDESGEILLYLEMMDE